MCTFACRSYRGFSFFAFNNHIIQVNLRWIDSNFSVTFFCYEANSLYLVANTDRNVKTMICSYFSFFFCFAVRYTFNKYRMRQ